MNQRKATCSTILAVLEERGVKYELNGQTPIQEVLTESDRKEVANALFAMFRANQVEMSEEAKDKYQDDKALKSYITGLISNWVRKAPEFNAGGKYVAKNPGSRAGQGDEQVKEMKRLLSITTDPEKRTLIESAIASRVAEIKPEANVEIDANKLPESLRHLIK